MMASDSSQRCSKKALGLDHAIQPVLAIEIWNEPGSSVDCSGVRKLLLLVKLAC